MISQVIQAHPRNLLGKHISELASQKDAKMQLAIK